MTQSGWSIQWITEHFRHPTEEGSFACYPDLTIIFRIFLGHSIYEEIMSIKMNASWVWHIHAIISIVLCSGAFISPLEATVVLMLLEVTGIPLAIATIADAMGYNGVAAVSGMCFAAVWFIFRLCLFTPYVVFYLCRTHRSLVATSADLSDSMKLAHEISLYGLFVLCCLNWYWGWGIYRKIMKQFKTKTGDSRGVQVRRNRWYHHVQKVMDDLNKLYLCPMWIQFDEYKTKVVKSVDEYKHKMEEYKAELVKSVDGYTSNLAKSVDVYKTKVAQSIDVYKTKVEEYKTKVAKNIANSVDDYATNFHEKVDGMKKVVASTVDQIQTVKTKMQELNSLGNSPESEAKSTLRRRVSSEKMRERPKTQNTHSWPVPIEHKHEA